MEHRYFTARCDCSFCTGDNKKDDGASMANLFCDKGCKCPWCVPLTNKFYTDSSTQTDANNFILVNGKMYLLIETIVI